MNLSAACGEHVIVRDAMHLKDGDTICLAADPEFSLKTIYTPGHTTDSVIFYSEKDHAAFVVVRRIKRCTVRQIIRCDFAA